MVALHSVLFLLGHFLVQCSCTLPSPEPRSPHHRRQDDLGISKLLESISASLYSQEESIFHHETTSRRLPQHESTARPHLSKPQSTSSAHVLPHDSSLSTALKHQPFLSFLPSETASSYIHPSTSISHSQSSTSTSHSQPSTSTSHSQLPTSISDRTSRASDFSKSRLSSSQSFLGSKSSSGSAVYISDDAFPMGSSTVVSHSSRSRVTAPPTSTHRSHSTWPASSQAEEHKSLVQSHKSSDTSRHTSHHPSTKESTPIGFNATASTGGREPGPSPTLASQTTSFFGLSATDDPPATVDPPVPHPTNKTTHTPIHTSKPSPLRAPTRLSSSDSIQWLVSSTQFTLTQERSTRIRKTRTSSGRLPVFPTAIHNGSRAFNLSHISTSALRSDTSTSPVHSTTVQNASHATPIHISSSEFTHSSYSTTQSSSTPKTFFSWVPSSSLFLHGAQSSSVHTAGNLSAAPTLTSTTSDDHKGFAGARTTLISSKTSVVTSPTARFPANLPDKIIPSSSDGSMNVPHDSRLVSFLFHDSLSWMWLVKNSNASAQVFAYMPSVISRPLNVSDDAISTVALAAYTPVTYDGNAQDIQSLFLAYVPSDQVSSLGAMVKTPSSPFYTQPGIYGQLAAQVDPSFSITTYDDGSKDVQAGLVDPNLVKNKGSGLSPGAIVAAVVVPSSVLVFAVLAIIFFYRRKKPSVLSSVGLTPRDVRSRPLSQSPEPYFDRLLHNRSVRALGRSGPHPYKESESAQSSIFSSVPPSSSDYPVSSAIMGSSNFGRYGRM